jgi:DNA-directed RNA polymerases I, II, and III subunit RPABC2
MSDIEDSFSEDVESVESAIDEIDDDIDVSDIEDETDMPFEDIGQPKKAKGVRQSIAVMTKYEYATIIGNRAKDIDCGVVPNITVPEHMTNSIDIAELEMKQGKTPYIVRRYHTNDTYEDFSVKELILPNL